ncbi:unnamed protein product [Heligmosomoides polygyrus]|uniref:Integrase catalytic domain-containing protein n=1 Tax=Heligmosomoides polygyrus TaxID=6339 RepID=A0A183GLP5_HELPZ|nr:unnamed protein product [Heligmosomoides polygyrus]
MCATYAITGVLPSSLLLAVSFYLCNLEWHEPAQGQPLCVEAQVLRLEQRRSRKQPKAARKLLKDQVAVSKKLLTGIITGEPETRVYSGPVTLERYSSCQLSDASDSNQPQILDARRLNIQAAIADLTSAIRTVQERRQMFLATVEGSANPEADNAAYENYMQETPVNDAVVDAESIISTLNHSLDEVQLLIERCRLAQLSEVTQSSNTSTEASASLETTASHTSQQQVVTAPQSPVQAQLSLSSNAPAATTIPTPQLPYFTTIQLSKYKLQPFDGDITKFQRFWGAFQLAVHNNPNIPPLEKYLQLQSLLTGDAIMVLDDVDPADNNYFELPYTCSSNSFLKHETRVPSSVAPGLGSQLYFTVFVDTIRVKLHELEYQSNSQFDLDQIMRKLDHIIISQERYENSTTLGHHFTVNMSQATRSSSRSPTPSNKRTNRCCFCGSDNHNSTRCYSESHRRRSHPKVYHGQNHLQ